LIFIFYKLLNLFIFQLLQNIPIRPHYELLLTKTLSKAMMLVKWIKSSNIDFSTTQTIDTLHRIGAIPDKKRGSIKVATRRR